MARTRLSVSARKETGSSAAKVLRREGMIPGIIYGRRRDPLLVKLAVKDVHAVKDGHIAENTLLDITIKEEKGALDRTVIVKEIQKDVMRGDWLHIDFNEISMEDKLKTEVSIEVVGEAVGVTQGGILDQITHELEIECLPTDIPEKITVDVTNLAIAHTIYVRDLNLGEKITILSDLDLPIVSVAVMREEEVAPVEAAAEGEAAEPEVISKGKKEEEEIDAPLGAPKGVAKGAPQGDSKKATKEKEEKK